MIQFARLPDARAESTPDAPAVADEDNGQVRATPNS